MGACSSACKGKAGASAPAVQPEVDAAAERTLMHPAEALCDKADGAEGRVGITGLAAAETLGHAEEVAADVAPVLEGAEVGKSCGWCCASASAVQLEAKADAAAESTMMQPVEALCVKAEGAEGGVEAPGETPGLAEEVAADGAVVEEGAESGKTCGWCCASASAVQPEVTADAAAKSRMIDAAYDNAEDERLVGIATEATGEVPTDAEEVVADGAVVEEGAGGVMTCGWCC